MCFKAKFNFGVVVNKFLKYFLSNLRGRIEFSKQTIVFKLFFEKIHFYPLKLHKKIYFKKSFNKYKQN